MKKNIVITGVSSGIGYALALNFLENGHNVLGISRKEATLVSVKERFKNFKHITGSLTDYSTFEKINQHVKENTYKVHILINNAGLLIKKPFNNLSEKDFYDSFSVNTLVPAKMIQHFLPYFAREAHVVNISSMGGFQDAAKFNGLAYYSASKAALCALTQCLAEELKEQNIKCNALCLGAVQTEMLAEAFPDYKAPLNAKQMADYIAWFALEGGNFFNGKILPVSSSTP